MRLSHIFLGALVATSVHASWFGSDQPTYKSWDETRLQQWLNEHNINAPKGYSTDQLKDLVQANWDTASGWTTDQYEKAQVAFQDLKDSSFDAWDESRLRQFLLEHGVVAPSGPREHLALLAKQKYNAYTNYASSISSTASAAASTALYGDSTHQASKSVSSAMAEATDAAQRQLDDTKDYVYSTWDDNQLRTYLEEKGVIRSKQQVTRDEMLKYMKDSYAAVASPVWKTWSDSYIHQWLVERGVIKSDFEKRRDALYTKMNMYYYDVSQPVYATWDESQMKQWLVDHGIVKTDAQIRKEKMLKLLQDNYHNAADTIWGSWKDSDMREWLIEHGYLRSDAQVKRDELVKLMNDNYKDYSARTAAYLTWPDARLRAYLREKGVSENALPTDRPSLLQEVRIRWVQTKWRSEALYNKVLHALASGVEIAEEKLGQVLEILSGTAEEGKAYFGDKSDQAKSSASSASLKAQASASSASFKAAASSASLKGKASSASVKGRAESATGKAKSEL